MDEEVTTAALAELEPVEFGISELDIARARAKYKALSADSREGYEAVRLAIAELRTTRTGIEKRRVELKFAALEHGRKVDAVAKQLTAMIVEIETPLLAKKAAIDDEKERLKREAEKAELVALEAKLKAEREAEQERLRVETARLAEQRAAHEAERRQVEADQRAAQARIDAERKALDEQRRAMDAQHQLVARQEAERVAAAQAEQDARDAAGRAEAEAAAEAQRQEAESARLEALKPDIEKVRAFGMAVRLIIGGAPALESTAGAEAIAWAVGRLELLATQLERFTPRKAA